jgi:tetratricopeptide (TPR) repeat protein
MRFRSGLFLALAVGFGLGGCAAATTGASSGPLTSPTGRVYEPGTRPTQTNFSRSATVSLVQGNFAQALQQSREGIASNPENPIHFFLAGEAAVGLGDFALADSMWVVAERIYPAYELEVEPSREGAWADAFNAGVEQYNSGSASGAIQQWMNADLIYRLRPEAAQNLAIVLTQEGQYEEAVRYYNRGLEALDLVPATRELTPEEIEARDEARSSMRRNLANLLVFTDRFEDAERILRLVLQENPNDIEAQASLATALQRLGREDEATQIYSRLLSAPNLPPTELFNIGVALFNAEDFTRAAQAFGRVTQAQPDSRDAWFNQANALYAAENWTELIPVAQRLTQVDPLNQTGALILTRAFREQNRSTDALQVLQRLEDAPVFVDDLQLRPTAQRTTVTGRVIGNAAAPGTPVRLRFHFFSDTGAAGSQMVTVTAPAREASVEFEVATTEPASAYRYELVQ